jgi:hypothetical protein
MYGLLYYITIDLDFLAKFEKSHNKVRALTSEFNKQNWDPNKKT